ncbi:MAG: hypothetical protein KDH88_13675 [Chromatiales bacterium]|nr:hypothetical protein [Chromatiales bacterium]
MTDGSGRGPSGIVVGPVSPGSRLADTPDIRTWVSKMTRTHLIAGLVLLFFCFPVSANRSADLQRRLDSVDLTDAYNFLRRAQAIVTRSLAATTEYSDSGLSGDILLRKQVWMLMTTEADRRRDSTSFRRFDLAVETRVRSGESRGDDSRFS